MSSEISKGVVQRDKSLRSLLAALMGQQGVHVTEVLAEQVRPDLQDGENPPDFLASVRALGRRLEATMRRLSEADLDVVAVKARLKVLARRRDALVSELAAAIVRLRRLVLAQYEAPNLKGMALVSPRSYRSTPLLSQAARIVWAFASKSLEALLGRAFDEVGVDPRVLVERVENLALDLWEALDEISDAQRLLDVAVIEKNELQAEYDRLFLNTARNFESYCRLAGMSRLADKVRPSKRRPGRMEVEPVEEVPARPEAAGEAEEAPTTEQVVVEEQESQHEERSRKTQGDDGLLPSPTETLPTLGSTQCAEPCKPDFHPAGADREDLLRTKELASQEPEAPAPPWP